MKLRIASRGKCLRAQCFSSRVPAKCLKSKNAVARATSENAQLHFDFGEHGLKLTCDNPTAPLLDVDLDWEMHGAVLTIFSRYWIADKTGWGLDVASGAKVAGEIEGTEQAEDPLSLARHWGGSVEAPYWDGPVVISELTASMAVTAAPPQELPMGDDGMDRLRQGDVKSAFEQFKYAEAILLANQMEGDSTSLLATTCNNLGCYYKKVGKFHGALGYLRRALKLEVELKTDEVTLAGTHLNLCAVLSKLEKHDKALQHALVALDMLNKKIDKVDTQASQDDYTILSIAYHNVGLEREHMQQWDQATIAFRTGYEVAKRFLGESHALTVTLLNNSNAVLKKSKEVDGSVCVCVCVLRVGVGS
eukprot:s9_g16.t1